MDNSFKTKLEQFKNSNSKVRITFKYPIYNSFTFKRGKVLDVYNDCFDFEDIFDGTSTYAYTYLIEVKEEDEEDGHEGK